jgi:hypothetical protein
MITNGLLFPFKINTTQNQSNNNPFDLVKGRLVAGAIVEGSGLEGLMSDILAGICQCTAII